jgi:hypothetical protein
MVIRSIVCGRPPGRAGLAPHACLHNITPDVIDDDCNAIVGTERTGGWPADGAVVEQPPTTDASPAPPAIASSRRRLTPLAPSNEGLSINCKYPVAAVD